MSVCGDAIVIKPPLDAQQVSTSQPPGPFQVVHGAYSALCEVGTRASTLLKALRYMDFQKIDGAQEMH
jgi:hypothetical protein